MRKLVDCKCERCHLEHESYCFIDSNGYARNKEEGEYVTCLMCSGKLKRCEVQLINVGNKNKGNWNRPQRPQRPRRQHDNVRDLGTMDFTN